jgi:hypothetical protein
MASLTDLFTWILEKDIRAKNAVCALCGLVSGVAFYLVSRDWPLLQELKDLGAVGSTVRFATVFLIAFLTAWLVWTAIASRYHRVAKERTAKQRSDERVQNLRDTLFRLTDWQRRFLLRFITEGTTQIPDYQVGEFRAVWESEMSVLVAKGVVIEHRRAGVYEIAPAVLHYLEQHWDPNTGDLT